MPNRETLALELSALEEHSAKDLRPYLEALSEDPGDEALAEMLGALLLDRVLHLLRRGSRLDLVDESVEFASFVESESGERLREARPELHASWCAFEELLAEAADRSDRDAIDSILLSHRGRGQKVLEVLAERAEPVRRAEIRQALGEEVSDSLVSHLLRDLEEADLIVRFRPRKSKEVLVELGPVGRDVVRRKVLPAWVEYLCEQIVRLNTAEGGAPSSEEIRQGLVTKGAPSELVARRLTEALAGLMPVSLDETVAGDVSSEADRLSDGAVDKLLKESVQIVSEVVLACENLATSVIDSAAARELFDRAQSFYDAVSKFCKSFTKIDLHWSRGYRQSLQAKASQFYRLEESVWLELKGLLRSADSTATDSEEFRLLSSFLVQAHAKLEYDLSVLIEQLRALSFEGDTGEISELVTRFIQADEIEQLSAFFPLMNNDRHFDIIDLLSEEEGFAPALAMKLWSFADLILMESDSLVAKGEQDTAIDLLNALADRADTGPYLKTLWMVLADPQPAEGLFIRKFRTSGVDTRLADLEILWRSVISSHKEISSRFEAAAKAPLSALWSLTVYHKTPLVSLWVIAQRVKEREESDLKKIFFSCIRPRLMNCLSVVACDYANTKSISGIISLLFTFKFFAEDSYFSDLEALLALYRSHLRRLALDLPSFEDEINQLRGQRTDDTAESQELGMILEWLPLPAQHHLAKHGSFVNFLACHGDSRVASQTARYIVGHKKIDGLVNFCVRNGRVPNSAMFKCLQVTQRKRLITKLDHSISRIKDRKLESLLRRRLTKDDLALIQSAKRI